MSEENTNPNSKIPWIIGGLLLLLALPFGYLILYSANTKTGIEFSPDDFTVRRFSYTKVDWLNWTMAGLQHEDITTPLHESLVDDLWIQTVSNAETTWHLVSDNVTPDDSPDFDARILDDYLQMEFWSDWNDKKKNDKKAKALWPAVATLARNNAYWAIPDLMDLAIDQKSLTGKKFIEQVSLISTEALMQNANQLVDQEKFEEAEKSLTAALTFGSSPTILRARAVVYDKLEKPELATADRNLAEKDAVESPNED